MKELAERAGYRGACSLVHDAFMTDRFDIGRTTNPHMAFGFGIHRCLGASLARAEMQEALPILAATLRHMRVADEPASAASKRYTRRFSRW